MVVTVEVAGLFLFHAQRNRRQKGDKREMNFSGFDDWVAIFQGGKQVDSSGREHDGDTLIDKALAMFNPSYHEPPLVIGHPEHDSPAFGWVSGLKRVGSVLWARFKNVHPALVQAMKEGFFKKRSASFYPDGRLRHVGLLGGMPPAVKGLPDLAFGEGSGTGVIEFSENVERMNFVDSSILEEIREGLRIAEIANRRVTR